jgi:cysteine-rich repeat protein
VRLRSLLSIIRFGAILVGAIGASLSTAVPAQAMVRGFIATTTSTLEPSLTCGNWSVTFGIDSAPVGVGAFQIRVGYAAAGGEFVRDLADVWCTPLLEEVSVASTEFTEAGELVIGMISVDGVPGGTEYVSCVFAGTFEDAPVAGDFAIEIEDSTDAVGDPVAAVPSVTVTALTEPGDCEDRCGDGVAFGDEDCDDANESNGDDCLDDCTLATCGDGFMHDGVEACDDGNASNLDECLNGCLAPACGDGHVYVGVETCDDGNGVDSDACVACTPAVCGDGFVYASFEQCDDAGTDSHDGCSKVCRYEQTCGNPVADGEIKTSDALRVLQKSVGIAVDCPTWACDVNETGAVTVGDALRVLRRSVGVEVTLSCGLPKAVTFRAYVPTSGFTEMRSIIATVDYSAVPGEFVGSAGEVDCQPLLPGAVGTFLDNEAASRLTFEVGGGTRVALPVDVARCTFSPTAPFAQDDFEVKTVSATRPNGTTLNVLLAVLPD